MENNINTHRDDILQPLIDQVASDKTKYYILNRIMPQMVYYKNASRKCKKRYTCWMIVAIIIGAAIPVLSVIADGGTLMKLILAALGSGVTAINAYLSLENSKDLWRNYRQEREILLSTLYCYFYNAGTFAHLESQEAKDALLIETCEREMSKEVGNWTTMLQS